MKPDLTHPQTSSRVSLSVVIPLFNEAASLGELLERLAAVLPQDAEVLFVDDGSTDDGTLLLKEAAQKDRRWRVLRLQRNAGKSAALAAGFERARGEVVAMMDADLQEDPADLMRLVERLDAGAVDLVGGWRRRRLDGFLKVFVSRVFNLMVRLLGRIQVRDINCGLKVMRRPVAKQLAMAPGFHRFIPLLAQWNGFRVTEQEVRHRPRRHGRSRYGGERLFSGLLDLIVMLFLVRQRGRPGRYFIAGGGLLGASGAGICAYLALLRITTGSIQSRFPLLAFGLLLIVVGVQLVSLGFFGELLAYQFRSRSGGQPACEELTGTRSRRRRHPQQRRRRSRRRPRNASGRSQDGGGRDGP